MLNAKIEQPLGFDAYLALQDAFKCKFETG